MIRGLTGIYNPAFNGTTFALWVDAGLNAGYAVQAIVTYDWTGDGSWDRTEIHAFFALDPLDSTFEVYAQSLTSVVGDPFRDMNNGRVRIELWEALPAGGTPSPVTIRTQTVVSGQLSSMDIPYTMTGWLEPIGCST